MSSGLTVGALSYAGINLPPATAEMDQVIATLIPTQDVQEFARQMWPGPRLLGMTWYNSLPWKDIKLGSLRWPVGAMRWATFHSLVTDTELTQLRPVCYPSGSPLQVQSLDIDDGRNAITAQMYMLPPRHLTGANILDAWLLTLVDQRWFWWQTNCGVINANNASTWPALYGAIANALNVPIAFDPISADYLTPQLLGGFASQYEAVPILLDAVAYNVGQRVVCDFDGSVHCMNLVNSVSTRNNNLNLPSAQAEPIAGGPFNFDQAITPG